MQRTTCSNVGSNTHGADVVLTLDFLKVVSTKFAYLNGDIIDTNQYSVTQYERDLRQGNAPGKDGHARE